MNAEAKNPLAGRNYALVLDHSGSMGGRVSAQDGRSRWKAAEESTMALARKCAEFDPDGIDVLPFSTSFKHYPNVTPDKVEQVFKEREPNGSTGLAAVLKFAIDTLYFAKKERPLTIVVVTDGVPDDGAAVAKVIIDASQKLDKDEELAISFVQIGDDQSATEYLKSLDDNLKGAKFDIVDAVTFAEMGEKTLTEVLLAAIED